MQLIVRLIALQPGMVTNEQSGRLESRYWKKVKRGVPVLFIVTQLMHAGAISQSLSSTVAPSAIQPLGEKNA